MDVVYSNIGTEPVTLEELKLYLKIDFDDDDDLLEDMITASREQAEQFCGRSFVVKTIEISDMDYDDVYLLPFPDHDVVEVVKINDVDYLDSTYKVGSNQITLKLPIVTTDITVDNSGLYVKYTTKGSCPKGVKLAIMKSIAESYDNRANVNEENMTAALTENSYAMLWRYVIM